MVLFKIHRTCFNSSKNIAQSEIHRPQIDLKKSITLSFAMFSSREAQFTNSRRFCRSREGDEPHWTLRWWTCLILFEFFSPDLIQWLWATSQNPQFQAYHTLLLRRNFCNLSEISCIICCKGLVRTCKALIPKKRSHVDLCGFQLTYG